MKRQHTGRFRSVAAGIVLAPALPPRLAMMAVSRTLERIADRAMSNAMDALEQDERSVASVDEDLGRLVGSSV